MLKSLASKGLVLYNRNYREDDKLVKIFTEQAGKRMFFVKHAGKSKLAPVIQPLTAADLLVKVNDDGLSYIEDYQDVTVYSHINEDLFIMAYASYVAALADASLPDNQADSALFVFLQKTLELMDEGLDYEVLTNIFEIQILSRFGIALNFHDCVFCHRTGLPFDFSFRYSGLLCPDHYHKDERRCHLNPNVPFLLEQFQAVKFSELESISLKADMKQQLRAFIDQLYDEYVGIHLKSKKFIDSLGDWGSILKNRNEEDSHEKNSH
ncbi:DNA repair protein RecO [Streptococcus panodentis]|uniref:DNA repair protein RecO n=1 Tax=Streptococcus panodentis TaxID=1581472 RepID=A0ABS5AWJ9_9STRE|nr:DNA repair protein RecO [Streptococcus panodentis]MBP2620953.1 DNA repair protein RecO [Streptococcus panodentis]